MYPALMNSNCQVMETVPDNAVVIEIAPHALLRKTIEETVAPSVQTLAPMSRQGENSARLVMQR